MDFKITNYDVSTEQIYLEQVAELPIDTDFSLSDYEGDIKKILNCEVLPYITTKQISGNTFITEGQAKIKVIYCTPEGRICCTEQELPFKKNFESSKNLDGGYGEVYTNVTIHSCRAVTERKISIRCSLKLEVTVTVIEKNEIISDIDSSCFEQLKGDAFATSPLGKTQKSIIIDEEIVLPHNLPDAQRIIRTNAVSNITDCKIIADKTIIKGNLKITILYCTEENEFVKHTVNIPYNQIVDVPGISEFCDCDADTCICGLDISTRKSDEDEGRKFMLICKLEISVFARCSSNIPVIYDLYSTHYTATPKCSEVKFSKLIKQVDEDFICKKVISLPEAEKNNILDVWCKNGTLKIKYENNSAVLSGSIIAYIIYENSDATPDFFERIIDFEYPVNLDENTKAPFCHPDIKIFDCDFSTTSSGEPEIKLELIIHACIYDTFSYSVITELEIDENTPIKNNASIIAYYADKGENIWEIAKSFAAKRNEFLKINHLTEDIITTDKMLLIPLI